MTARGVASWFLLFVIYGFVGWIYEIIVTLLLKRKLSNRGFLIGPVLPIYGLGGVLATAFIDSADHVLEIFCMVVIFGGILEYVTSFLLEKIFHARWWDYSKLKFQLNGRVCLRALVLFGLLGVLAVKVVSPWLFGLFDKVNNATLISVALAIGSIFLVDVVISLVLIFKFRKTARKVSGDATDEITEYMREMLLTKGKLNRRLAKAFPDMKVKKVQPRQKRTRKSTKNSANSRKQRK